MTNYVVSGTASRPAQPEPLRSHGPAWLVQAALIARRSLVEGRSKVEIADETGLSRFKVARILEEARALGLVQISVSVPGQIDTELSSALTDRFGLRRAIVTRQIETGPGAIRHTVAGIAADLVSEIVSDDDVLGLTCSRSVDAMTRHLKRLAPCRVIQLTGTLASADIVSGGVESVRRAAAIGGGKGFPIYAPIVVPDAATAAGLANQSGIAPVIAQFTNVTIAVVAVGAWLPGESTAYRAVSDDVRADVTSAGGVGEIGARVFDSAGTPIESPLTGRVLGIELEQLKNIDEVVCLAYGTARATAVLGAIHARMITSVVCDAEMASALLDGIDAMDRDQQE